MEKLNWRTEKRIVDDLVPYEPNPRQISETQLEKLKDSLEKFNLVEIPAIDADNTIIAGHQRLKVMQLLDRGDEEIEVRVPNRKLTHEEFEQYLLTSNRSGGDWDFDLLKEFDIELLLEVGFDATDLSHIWDDILSIEDDQFDEDKALEKASETNIELGDVFALGKHRLICGDATDKETVQKLVGSTKIDLVNTDPVYNINLDYNAGLGGESSYGGTTNDNKSQGEYESFLNNLITNALSVTNEDAHIFFWCDEKYIGLLQNLYARHEISHKRNCLWIKGPHNPTPKVAFNKCTEYCIYGTVGKPYLSERIKNLTELQNKNVDSGNRLIDDVLDLLNIWLVKRVNTSDYEHPTTKPPALYEKSLRRCSKPGDKILDLCGGSGSSLIAAEQLNRMAYLVEIEPVFCQVIINRYEKLTGEKAEKIN
ncbi:MAG: DNA modification methylase [Candidatus Paceibacterota bacterium]